MPHDIPPDQAERRNSYRGGRKLARKSRHKVLISVAGLAFAIGLLAVAGIRLENQAHEIRSELDSAAELVPGLERAVSESNTQQVQASVAQLRLHTFAAREASEDPLWKIATALPVLGANFSAVTELARTADDVAVLGVTPLANVFESLDWKGLLTNASGSHLAEVERAAPSVASAAHAVKVSSEKLNQIDETGLLPDIGQPLVEARKQLQRVAGTLDAAADASQLAPALLGSDSRRSYLLIVQNNAESRSSGGIPGAVAVLTADKGKLALESQSSAAAIGVMDPVLPVDEQQRNIYSARLGKYMQDVNLTPDFPTAGAIAKAMWERKSGQQVDGVISIDPIALSYVLEGTGPVRVSAPELRRVLETTLLPSELTSKNVVRTLLSDVYAKIDLPAQQDTFYAGVAGEIFSAFSKGQGDASGLLDGVSKGVEEGRILIWSARSGEQSVIGDYPLSGSIVGPSISPAQFGVYFNDGTGAKMDYYVKRTVQLFKECPRDGYEQTTVRITSTNTAPADAANSLPAYVTGDGNFGVPPGSVQTNVAAYGPVQANVETAKLDGQKTQFAPYLHSNRPVGVIALRLAPGESRSVDFTFGKIVQHSEPNVVVTPTVQPVKEVILPTQNASCG